LQLEQKFLPRIRMNPVRQSRNQTTIPDFYRRFRRFDPDKTKGTDDQWLG